MRLKLPPGITDSVGTLLCTPRGRVASSATLARQFAIEESGQLAQTGTDVLLLTVAVCSGSKQLVGHVEGGQAERRQSVPDPGLPQRGHPSLDVAGEFLNVFRRRLGADRERLTEQNELDARPFRHLLDLELGDVFQDRIDL